MMGIEFISMAWEQGRETASQFGVVNKSNSPLLYPIKSKELVPQPKEVSSTPCEVLLALCMSIRTLGFPRIRSQVNICLAPVPERLQVYGGAEGVRPFRFARGGRALGEQYFFSAVPWRGSRSH
ncbi:jg1876 [Pararge aegeria aegeria]|uniref:Jg1876 protein n=1 Tax=Pararge aegeria aegeria TaxID=348720 RepID=A0A8S4QVF7_9NEOP|nr:jg1876 [Pararge aegeria aegeria]